MANDLEGISRAIQRSADMREAERVQANAERGEPALFIPDSDPELQQQGFGMGYWPDHKEGCVWAFRKMANGYQRYAAARLEVALMERLVKLYDEAKS